VSRLAQTGDDQTMRLRDVERRLAELEARPRVGVAAAQPPFTTSNGPHTDDATTDFAITGLVTDPALGYAVKLRSQVLVGASALWTVELYVDGVITGRLHTVHLNGTEPRDFIDAELPWEPIAGTHDLQVRVDRVVAGGTLTFEATSDAPRQFWVEVTGPRV
jgi:hypothetical protein